MAFPFPVMAPISSTVLFWIPLLEIFHLVQSPNWQSSAITGTGRDSFCTISGTGHAISSTVIHWAPYQNWTLCTVGMPVGGFVVSVCTMIAMADGGTGNGDGAMGYNDDNDGGWRRTSSLTTTTTMMTTPA